jgi:hypothetical protein
MRVEVEWTTEARAEQVELLEAFAPTGPDALLTAMIDLEEMTAQFERHGGPPPGARVRPRPSGGWWLYANGLWVAYTSRDQSFGWIRPRRVRRIAVVAVEATPPPP